MKRVGFLPSESIAQKHTDTPWKKKERDRVLDKFFSGGAGASPRALALKVGRSVKAIQRLIEQITSNEDDRVIRYRPRKRISRKGLRFTQNEMAVIRGNHLKGVPLADTARLLCRDAAEIPGPGSPKEQVMGCKRMQELAPSLDLIWAHRYIYFVYQKPLLLDAAYDMLVKEEIEYGGGSRAFLAIKEHRGWPDHIISLALYLCGKKDVKYPNGKSKLGLDKTERRKRK